MKLELIQSVHPSTIWLSPFPYFVFKERAEYQIFLSNFLFSFLVEKVNQ